MPLARIQRVHRPSGKTRLYLCTVISLLGLALLLAPARATPRPHPSAGNDSSPGSHSRSTPSSQQPTTHTTTTTTTTTTAAAAAADPEVEYNPITLYRAAATAGATTAAPSAKTSPATAPPEQQPAGKSPPGVDAEVEYIPNVFYRREVDDTGVIYDPVAGLQREEWHVRDDSSGELDAFGVGNVVRMSGQGEDVNDEELLQLMRVSATRNVVGSNGTDVKTAVRQGSNVVRVRGSQSTITVTFEDDTPTEARAPFRSSMETWANTFPSAVEVRIQFRWMAIPGGTLAATTTPFFLPGSARGADKLDDDTVYGSVMAASLQGRDFIRSSENHITMAFNSRVNWHFGESNAPIDRWDLATTSLHEVCHGLFFSGVAQADQSQRVAGFSSQSQLPGRFDKFLSASNKASVANVCSLDARQFFNALTNSGLRFTDPDTPGTDFGLYSPTNYLPGSSTYHHDPSRLEQDCRNNEISSGDCSDLMTHKLPNGYTQRSVGEPVKRTLAALRSGNGGVTGGANCQVPAGSGSSGSGTKTDGVFGGGFSFPVWAIAVVAGIAGVGALALLYALCTSISGRRRR